MSLKIIKAGLSDSIQDLGRYGYQHLGINPGGAMDRFAAQLVNILLGNDPNEALIEMHFPAPAFLLEEAAVVAIGGADFSPTINGETVALWQPVIVNKNSVLQFGSMKKGARCYLAVKGGFHIIKWLDSYSTNLLAAAGGFQGRILKQNDSIDFKEEKNYAAFLSDKEMEILPWKADAEWNPADDASVFVLPGNEWDWLEQIAQENFLNQPFTISNASDRMGYRLSGEAGITNQKKELVSSAVSFGSIQLLPGGQLILLMADHQTTGGYPRVGQVITAHLSKLAQMRPGEQIRFQMTDLATAEELFCKQQQHLLQLQNACTFRLSEFFKT